MISTMHVSKHSAPSSSSFHEVLELVVPLESRHHQVSQMPKPWNCNLLANRAVLVDSVGWKPPSQGGRMTPSCTQQKSAWPDRPKNHGKNAPFWFLCSRTDGKTRFWGGFVDLLGLPEKISVRQVGFGSLHGQLAGYFHEFRFLKVPTCFRQIFSCEYRRMNSGNYTHH